MDMRTTSLVAVFSVWLPLLASRAFCQCPEPTEVEVEDFTLIHPMIMAPEGVEVELEGPIDYNINCLAAAPTRGYIGATVTVVYKTNIDIMEVAGQLILECSSQTWRYREFRPDTSLRVDELLAAETDVNCISCSPYFNEAAGSVPPFCTGT